VRPSRLSGLYAPPPGAHILASLPPPRHGPQGETRLSCRTLCLPQERPVTTQMLPQLAGSATLDPLQTAGTHARALLRPELVSSIYVQHSSSTQAGSALRSLGGTSVQLAGRHGRPPSSACVHTLPGAAHHPGRNLGCVFLEHSTTGRSVQRCGPRRLAGVIDFMLSTDGDARAYAPSPQLAPEAGQLHMLRASNRV
jgi:hypothetical protein